MQKLKRLINNYLECGGIGFNVTFPVAQELIYILGAMQRNERPSTTNRDVKRILDDCGIATITYLDGWKVSHTRTAC